MMLNDIALSCKNMRRLKEYVRAITSNDDSLSVSKNLKIGEDNIMIR